MAKQWETELRQSLSRVSGAMEPRETNAPAPPPAAPMPFFAIGRALALAASVALFALAALGGHGWLVAPGLLLLFLARGTRRRHRRLARSSGPLRPHIGMGATVAADAALEPGAIVEMVATVGSGARIASGARVCMGATIGERAVIEGGAVVSWGATIDSDASVGEGARICAGATVKPGARVPPGMVLAPGSTFTASRAAAALRPAAAPAKPVAISDPREERAAAVCERLDSELRSAPQSAKELLGASIDSIAQMPGVLRGLRERERALRAEASPETLARLGEERSGLAARIDAERDEVARGTLQAALGAIDEQKRERELLRRNADRLEAEHARLLYTLEGLSTQFLRMRTAGEQAVGLPPGVELSLQQLSSEVDAVANALEEVSKPEQPAAVAPSPTAMEPIGSAFEDSSEPDRRLRTR